MSNKTSSFDLLLENISVQEVDDYHLEINPTLGTGLLGWFMVVDEKRGAFSYFNSKTEALFYRLALINARLNPIGLEDLIIQNGLDFTLCQRCGHFNNEHEPDEINHQMVCPVECDVEKCPKRGIRTRI